MTDIDHEGWLMGDRGSSPTFTGSRLLDTCITVWGEGTNAVFRDNTVTGCLNGWAFDIAHGSTPIIEDNDVSVGGFEIYRGTVDGTRPVIRGNRIYEVGELASLTRGIIMRPATSAIIEANEITDASKGIEVSGADAELRQNHIHGNATGVRVLSASVSLEDNRIESNGTGLILGSGEATFVDNVICDNETNVRVTSEESPDLAVLAQTNEICPDPAAE